MAVDITLQVKDMFFDRQKVIKAIEKTTKKNLSRMARFIQVRAKQSLIRRKKSSRPGSQPYVKSKNKFANLKNILYFYEEMTETAVIGPVRFGRSNPPVPQLMEHGGTNTIKKILPVKKREAKAGRLDTGQEIKLFYPWHRNLPKDWQHMNVIDGTFNYAPRPFMEPARDAELKKVEAVWEDSLEVRV